MKLTNLFLLCFALAACARSPAYNRESQSGSGKPQSPQERQRVLDKAQKFSNLRKRTVLLPFWNDTPVKGRFEVDAKNALKDMLLDQNRINIVDERDISFRSQDFYLDSEKVDVNHLAENGRKWGVSLIVLGRVSRIVFRKQDDDVGLLRPSASIAAASVELRMIDVAQAKEIAIGEGAGQSESKSLNLFGSSSDENDDNRNQLVTDAITDGIKKALPALNKEIDRIQWRGKVAKIAGNKIYVNAGRATGINLGDILKVTSSGTDIFDPDTGLFLGRTAGDVKGTLEVLEYFGEDGAVARVHSGANFTEGDQIQLY